MEKYLHWTINDWKRVCFRDGVSFKTGMDQLSLLVVWHTKGEEFHKDRMDECFGECFG
jgi:hypothetical protein